jgi:hypothetical protein
MSIFLIIKGDKAAVTAALAARGFHPTDHITEVTQRTALRGAPCCEVAVRDEVEPGVIRWFRETSETCSDGALLLHYSTCANTSDIASRSKLEGPRQ